MRPWVFSATKPLMASRPLAPISVMRTSASNASRARERKLSDRAKPGLIQSESESSSATSSRAARESAVRASRNVRATSPGSGGSTPPSCRAKAIPRAVSPRAPVWSIAKSDATPHGETTTLASFSAAATARRWSSAAKSAWRQGLCAAADAAAQRRKSAAAPRRKGGGAAAE